MDKPKCKLCGERHWSGEDHRWPAAVAPVDVTVETLHRPLPGMPARDVTPAKTVRRDVTPPPRDVTGKRQRDVTKKIVKPKPVLSPVEAVAVAPSLKTDGVPLTKAERAKRYREANPEKVKAASAKRMARKRAKARTKHESNPDA